MCTLPSRLLAPIVFAAGISACGGEALILPGESAPAALTAFAGAGQEGTAGSRLDEPLIAKVTDGASRPLPGIIVVFGFQNEIPGAQVDPAEVATNAEGLASAQVRLGESTGSQVVEAQVAQASGLVTTFPLTALADEKGKKDKGGDQGGHGDDDEDEDD